MQNSNEASPPPGVVELREDVPLKTGASFGADESSRCCSSGPRFILACFAVLTAGITLALLTQIYYGDYELVPHGSVSSSAAACSQAGTEALKAGGRAMDAAAATAICLAALAPHRTSLDASGSLLYWEYRSSHSQLPLLAEWGGPEPNAVQSDRPPRLLAALASLHSRLGLLPWSRVLQPAIDWAKNVSDDLTANAASKNGVNLSPESVTAALSLVEYLEKLQSNTSSELAAVWGSDKLVKSITPHETVAGGWRMFAGGAGAEVAGGALVSALQPPLPDPDTAFQKVVSSLQQAAVQGEWPPAGVATGLAVIDRLDTYIGLVTGLSKPFGTGPLTSAGWMYDIPTAPLDLAPAIIVEEYVCGTRYVIGAESSSALAQGVAALLTDGTGASAVERARVSVLPKGVLAIEANRDPPTALPVRLPVPLVNSSQPYPAVNIVMQRADDLMSHADSRGGGIAYRF